MLLHLPNPLAHRRVRVNIFMGSQAFWNGASLTFRWEIPPPYFSLLSHSNFVARVSTSLLLLLLLLFLLPQHKSNETSWKMIRRFCHVFNGCNFIAICNIIIMYYDLWLFSVLCEDFFSFATFTIQHWTRTTIMTQQLTPRVLLWILDILSYY